MLCLCHFSTGDSLSPLHPSASVKLINVAVLTTINAKMQHITEKELDILQYFYTWKRGRVRRIKKEVKISEHTLLKYLKTLEKRDMLHSSKEGNLKIYEVNTKSGLVKIFFSYFDFERLETLEYKRSKAVKLL